MKLRPLKQEEKHIRSALLADLKGKVRELSQGTLKKQVDQLRASKAKPAEVTPEETPEEPETPAEDEDEVEVETEADEVAEEEAAEALPAKAKAPKKPSLDDRIAQLSSQAGGKGRGQVAKD